MQPGCPASWFFLLVTNFLYKSFHCIGASEKCKTTCSICTIWGLRWSTCICVWLADSSRDTIPLFYRVKKRKFINRRNTVVAWCDGCSLVGWEHPLLRLWPFSDSSDSRPQRDPVFRPVIGERSWLGAARPAYSCLVPCAWAEAFFSLFVLCTMLLTERFSNCYYSPSLTSSQHELCWGSLGS